MMRVGDSESRILLEELRRRRRFLSQNLEDECSRAVCHYFVTLDKLAYEEEIDKGRDPEFEYWHETVWLITVQRI